MESGAQRLDARDVPDHEGIVGTIYQGVQTVNDWLRELARLFELADAELVERLARDPHRHHAGRIAALDCVIESLDAFRAGIVRARGVAELEIVREEADGAGHSDDAPEIEEGSGDTPRLLRFVPTAEC